MDGGDVMTVPYIVPVRNKTGQTFQYTYRDQNKSIINLLNLSSPASQPYTNSVFCELRLPGQAVITVAGTFISQSGGVVATAAQYVFTIPGAWEAQFYCTDAAGNRLYGEPILFTVAKNQDDAALTDLPLQL